MTIYKDTYWKNRKFLFPLALKSKLNYTNDDIEICISVLHFDEKKILNQKIKEIKWMNNQEKNNRIYKIICILVDISESK